MKCISFTKKLSSFSNQRVHKMQQKITAPSTHRCSRLLHKHQLLRLRTLSTPTRFIKSKCRRWTSILRKGSHWDIRIIMTNKNEKKWKERMPWWKRKVEKEAKSLLIAQAEVNIKSPRRRAISAAISALWILLIRKWITKPFKKSQLMPVHTLATWAYHEQSNWSEKANRLVILQAR